jgi:hypothetical protein
VDDQVFITLFEMFVRHGYKKQTNKQTKVLVHLEALLPSLYCLISIPRKNFRVSVDSEISVPVLNSAPNVERV